MEDAALQDIHVRAHVQSQCAARVPRVTTCHTAASLQRDIRVVGGKHSPTVPSRAVRDCAQGQHGPPALTMSPPACSKVEERVGLASWLRRLTVFGA